MIRFWLATLFLIASFHSGLTGCSDAADAGDQDVELEPAVVCPVADDLGPGEHELRIRYEGERWDYVLYVPENYDSGSPTALLFNIPGYQMSSGVEAKFSVMNPFAEEKGFIVVYPEPFIGYWNTGFDPPIGDPSTSDDVAFIRKLMAEVKKKLCIDPRRIYATGMSNGASMTHRLACEADDLFAAVAPVGGALGLSECTPTNPIPLIHYHGVQDNFVDYSLAQDSFRKWIEVNGCTGSPVRTQYNNSYCDAYEQCEGGVQVVLCSMDPMGHCWPGGSSALCIELYGPYNSDLTANPHMWEFLTQYTLP